MWLVGCVNTDTNQLFQYYFSSVDKTQYQFQLKERKLSLSLQPITINNVVIWGLQEQKSESTSDCNKY